jgi:hypothetical protein
LLSHAVSEFIKFDKLLLQMPAPSASLSSSLFRSSGSTVRDAEEIESNHVWVEADYDALAVAKVLTDSPDAFRAWLATEKQGGVLFWDDENFCFLE